VLLKLNLGYWPAKIKVDRISDGRGLLVGVLKPYVPSTKDGAEPGRQGVSHLPTRTTCVAFYGSRVHIVQGHIGKEAWV
jgi:hypothetical protein